jgi:hypothetical protein
MSTYLLPLSEALDVLKTNRATFKLVTALDDERIATMDRRGVDLDDAEIISKAYGMHPSEIWTGWVEAILTLIDWSERGEDVEGR